MDIPEKLIGLPAMLLIVVLITTTVTVICVGVHYEALSLLTIGLSRMRRTRRFSVALAIMGALAAHCIEVVLYGMTYWFMGHWPELGTVESTETLADTMYFSIVCYSSLGFGEIVPTGHIRLLAGVEALTGLVLIAWSSSFAFLQMQQFWKPHWEVR